MALFNLTDIKFKRETRGPLNPLITSDFKTNILKYPIDIGTSYDKGHYMVIYINEQENTASEFKRPTSSYQEPAILRISKEISRIRGSTNISQGIDVIGEKLLDGSVALTSKLGIPGVDKLINENTGKELFKNLDGNILRRIRRTTDAIALYMPDTLNFTYNQSYSDVSSFDALGKVGPFGVGTVAAAIASGIEAGTTNATPFVLQALQDAGVGAARLGLAATGVASNPGLELLYSSPSFRSFRFDFMFYPRSQIEAKAVMKIIKKLNFHQAPEIVSNAGGRFLVPPSEFDIEFLYNGYENPNIPRVSTCVLEQIDVDYAPNGFSAYEVPLESFASEGATGMPTAIRLSLQFKETQIVTKEFLTATRQINEGDVNFGD
jgi:hypothetical protein